MKNSWVDLYYDALEFYYWEPQHLGRKKPANPAFKDSKEVMDHLHRVEVPLNHLIKQFFSLAPISLRNRLFVLASFEPALTPSLSGEFAMAGRLIKGEYVSKFDAQPDFFFRADGKTVAIEMKINSTSNVRQVLMYTLLALAVELDSGGKMQHSLIYLGQGDFQALWGEHFFSVADLRRALEDHMHSFLTGRKECFREQAEQFFGIVKSLSIGFINYKDFARLLTAEEAHLDESIGSEVYQNLLNGMETELKDRGLS